jgi:hypothetical protein
MGDDKVVSGWWVAAAAMAPGLFVLAASLVQ